jgi:cellulose synthase/poly-beta-1,6-N-acetylglucosamine synthase-like glycosyltransferase
MKFKKQFKGNLHFIKSPEAMVYTQPLNSFMSFWMQRKRWASKSRQCKDVHFLIIGSIVLGTNLMLLLGLPISILVPSMFSSLFIFIFGSKLIVDFCFLFFATKFQNNKNLMVIFPIGAILNILNVSIFGLTGWFGKYNWKGRSH